MSKIYKKISNFFSSTIFGNYITLMYEKKYLNSLNEYFQLIEEIIQKYTIEKIKSPNEDIDKALNIPNISYKDLILKYFASEYEKGNLWVQNVYNSIFVRDFPSDEQILDSFFLDEFEIRAKPHCLNKNKDICLIPQSKNYTYKIINDLNSNNLNIQHELYIQNVYSYIRIIKIQIENPSNPINFIIQNFRNFLTNEANDKKEKLIDLKLHEPNEFEKKCGNICNNVFEQINNFVNHLTQCLALLYYKISNYQIIFEETDEFISLLITILFEEEKDNKSDLYKTIMDLISLSKIKEIKKLEDILKSNILLSPKDLNISEKYCLDEKSIKYYNNHFNKEFFGKLPKIPYEETINMLNKITEYKNPIDKLLLTTHLTSNVRKVIEEFWNKVDKEVLTRKELKLEIESDDFIDIFTYIILKSNLPEIISNIAFIEIFTTEKIRSRINDYNLSMLKVCILLLNDLKKKKL